MIDIYSFFGVNHTVCNKSEKISMCHNISTSTTDDEYFRQNRESLPLLLQRQLSKKSKICGSLKICRCIAVLISTVNFEHFQKEKQSHNPSFSEIFDSERLDYLNV